MFAIRADRDYVVQEDFMKAVRKVSDNKKLETKLDYKPVWILSLCAWMSKFSCFSYIIY